MEYTSPAHKGDLTPVDGYILQGPVCDRAAIALEVGMDKLDKSVATAKSMIDSGRGLECVPRDELPGFMQGSPISATRWYALGASEYVFPPCYVLHCVGSHD